MRRLGWGFLALCLFTIGAPAQQALPPVGPPTGIACAYNTSPPTVTTGEAVWVQCDSSGKLLSTSSGSGGASATDEAAFTAGTSVFAPSGGFFQTTPTTSPLTTGQQGLVQLTSTRAFFTNLRNAAGTEIGTAATPVQVSLANTAANATAVTVSATNLSTNVAQIGGTATVTGGVNGSLGIGGLAANGASVAGNPNLNGGRAQSAEITPVTGGQAVDAAYDLAGKAIVMPFANKELFVSGNVTITAATNTSVIAAAGSGVKIYLTGFSCYNSGATATTLLFTSGSGGTTIWQTGCPAGGGSNLALPTPVATAANAALFVTTGSASTSVLVSATGYTGS